jgi:hypothetical protein
MSTAPRNFGQPSTIWTNFVARSPIGALVVTSVIATQMGTYFGYVFPAVGLPTLPWPLYNGSLGLMGAEFNTPGSFFVGMTLHFVNGVVFGILYGILVRDMIPLKNTVGGNISKGLIYGVIMTIISAGVLVPYAYVPNQGYGLFLFDGPDGWKLPFAILVWHLIYGFFLGSLFQPKDPVDDRDSYAAEAARERVS